MSHQRVSGFPEEGLTSGEVQGTSGEVQGTSGEVMGNGKSGNFREAWESCGGTYGLH